MADMDISTCRDITIGDSGSSSMLVISANTRNSCGKNATFKGIRLMHGVIKNGQSARWRMYEDPGSKTGLPQHVK